jgi:hypothetical protein
MRWSSDASRATNAPVDVNATAGTSFFKVNQQTNGGTWVKLGAFDFAAGTTGNVLLCNDGANSFTDGSTVQAGTLDLAGSLASSVTVDGGTLALGATTGIRTVAGSLNINAGGTVRFRLNGTTAGTQYDQLRLTSATSSLTLVGMLDLVAAPAIAAGGTFRLIDNTGTSIAVTGTFSGLPEGAQFYEDAQWWRITYTGGTGNDVVLTRLTPTAWQTWQAANFGANANTSAISGNLADNDKDGVSDLLEYATKINPAANDVIPQSATKSASTIDFVYTKNKSATDVTFTVKWSDTLGNDWSTRGRQLCLARMSRSCFITWLSLPLQSETPKASCTLR